MVKLSDRLQRILIIVILITAFAIALAIRYGHTHIVVWYTVLIISLFIIFIAVLFLRPWREYN